MQKRSLGRSGLSIAPIVLGGNVFGWTMDEASSFAVLDVFVGSGFDCIDTADVYSRWVAGNKGGESETIIGNWLKRRGRRHDVVIATKVGGDMGGGRKGLSANYITEAVEASLKRLRVDYIDLYQEHFDDKSTPLEDIMEAFARANPAGQGARHRRVKYYAGTIARLAGDCGRERLAALRDPPAALQSDGAGRIRALS